MSSVDNKLQAEILSLLGIEYWQPLANEARPVAGDTATPEASIDTPQQPTVSSILLPNWETLSQQVKNCTACGLCQTRTQTVFGVGNKNAQLMLIGEAPGATEDRKGEPFVGQAGQLLDKMLAAIQFNRQDVFIANILKCRPPNNRDPQPPEVEKCLPFLKQQIAMIKPKLILALGRVAAQNLLETQTPLNKLRLRTFQYGDLKTPMMVTYHPAYLLRNPADKRNAWEDLLKVKAFLEE